MTSIKNILDGWRNYIVKSEVSEGLAEKRAKVCIGCDELKKGGLLTMIKDDFKEVEGFYCGLCKCPLSAKIRSINEKCELNKW